MLSFINNKRLEGHDYFRIMAATGHKTLSVFKRYNTVTRERAKGLGGGETACNGHHYGHHARTSAKIGKKIND